VQLVITPEPSAKPDRPFSGVPDTIELFDLKNDPLEKINLVAKHPEIVEKLKSAQSKHWNPQ
jgi:hypothetical protein